MPLVTNPHLLTLLAHFWPSGLDERRFPVERELVATEPEARVLVETQRPAREPRGELVLVHGLEGSSASSYMRSMARAALEAGFVAHRFNLRSCGGTEALAATGYHSGMTCDLLAFLRQLGRPAWVVGFSLGGNVALKLAGELGEAARGLVAGVCAVSTPIDLAACAGRLEEPQNRLYHRRFLRKLKRRVRRMGRAWPGSARSLRGFDDQFTAPMFGFRDAADYYATQSACRFLDGIRVPALLIQAKDDPVIPREVFERPGLFGNPNLEVVTAEHGGHLGFLARRGPRFWADQVIVEWIVTHLSG